MCQRSVGRKRRCSVRDRSTSADRLVHLIGSAQRLHEADVVLLAERHGERIGASRQHRELGGRPDRATTRRCATRRANAISLLVTALNALRRLLVEAEADDTSVARPASSGIATTCRTPPGIVQKAVPSPLARQAASTAVMARQTADTRPSARAAGRSGRRTTKRSARMRAWYSCAIGWTVGGSSVATAPRRTGRSAISSALTTKSQTESGRARPRATPLRPVRGADLLSACAATERLTR